MSNAKTWKKYFIVNQIRRYYNAATLKLGLSKLVAEPKFDRPVMQCNDVQRLISNFIDSGKPALISRFGCVESKCIGEGIGIQESQLKHFSRLTLHAIYNNAGVFPYGENMALRFCNIAVEAAKKADVLGVWNTEMHDYLINVVSPKTTVITPLGCLEPWNAAFPWSRALEGKHVLVIHPFAESIKTQYSRREMIFSDPNILPQFNLEVMKSVQTIAGEQDDRFDNWEEALNFMYEQSLKKNFDVAIIGCGAYGMPLGAMLKDAGKVAVHLGGATQVLFGIKGRRWDENETSRFYNQYWIRPNESEIPHNARNVENACYW